MALQGQGDINWGVPKQYYKRSPLKRTLVSCCPPVDDNNPYHYAYWCLGTLSLCGMGIDNDKKASKKDQPPV